MRLGVPWCVLMSVLVVSCTGLRFEGASLSPEESLRQRAAHYWAAQKNKTWSEVRNFVDPETVGKLDRYFKRKEESQNYSKIIATQIKDLKVEGDEGWTVTVVSAEITHPLLGGKPYPVEQTVEERWVRRDGVWYVVINPPNVEDFLRKIQQKPSSSAAGG